MNKESVYSGTIAGAVLVIVNIVIYLIDPLLLANWWLGLAMLPLMLAILLVIGLRIRTSEGGFITFGNAFLWLFVAGMIAGLISTIWLVLLHNVIDPELGELLIEETFERMMTMMEGLGAPMEQVEAEFDKARSEMEQQYTPATLFKGWLYSAIGWALGALIVSLIVKRQPPVDLIDA